MSGERITPVWPSDPSPELQAHRLTLADGGQSANPALHSEVLACQSLRGDWLAVLIAPSCVRVLLLPGGGELWGDIPLGQQRYLTLAGHDWKFVAAEHAALGAYQYCDLLPATDALRSMAEARLLAEDALATLGLRPDPVASPAEAPRTVSRRGFLRAFSGRR